MISVQHSYNNFQREREIYGLKCILPEPPPLKEIANYNLPQKDQRFVPVVVPDDLRMWQPEKRKEFEAREWKRRREGYWFFNNGNLEYITGDHYFYINYWKFPVVKNGRKVLGLPNWVDSDRDENYFWEACVNDPKCFGMLVASYRRSGKALDIRTKIPTPNGWTTMEELKEGDVVFDSKGKPTNVTFATEIQHNRNCYKITFSDHTELIADEDHQWIVYNKTARVATVRKDLKARKEVKTTRQLIEKIKTTDGKENNWSVETCLPVEYTQKELKIPPYIMGLWLGDGCSSNAKFTNIDQELIAVWKEYGETLGLKMRQLGDKITYMLIRENGNVDRTKGGGFIINPLREKLRHYNLLKNKHIPREYLESSIDDRIQLLRGLMDTDGCLYKGGRSFEFCQKHKHLVEEFKELIESLGQKCTITSKLNKKYNKVYYYVRFGINGINPFKLKRKAEKVDEIRTGGWRNNHRYIVDISPVESHPVKCIEVDSEDHSYLCGNFIVTHNTYRGLARLYNKLSQTPESHGGIQSKTDTDGRKVFNKMIKSWQKLPYYFKPIDTGDSHPATALRFYESSVKNTKTQTKDYSQVLRSEIDYGTALDEHYDGDGLLFHFGDEIGKVNPKNGNVLERWLVVKECISDGNIVTGKAMWTTTVEEMEKKGGRQFFNVWKISDQTKRNILGQTDGGLYRYFNPAYYGFRGDDDGVSFVDEYGYSNKDAALAYHQKKRSTLSGEALLSYRRKYPIYESDLFVIDNKESIFDLDRIYKQVEYNETLPASTVVRGNFVWEVYGQKAKFVFDDSGRWSIVWRPKDEDANKQTIVQGRVCPGNPNIVSGVDPFDHKFTSDNRKSNAASYVFKKFDPLDPDNSALPVAQYIARPHTPEMFYEDMLMQSIYYGCELLSENNKIGLINYFRQKGFQQYLMHRPESTHTSFSRKEQAEYGIPMTGDEARQSLMDAIIGYIYNHVGFDISTNFYGKLFFPELLEDLIAFDPAKWTPHDCTVAFGLSLLATQKKVIKRQEEGTNDKYFRTYKVIGNSSREINEDLINQMLRK